MTLVSLRIPDAIADPAVEVNAENHTLNNVSVIKAGPALGHGFEVDSVMLDQVVERINAKPKGVKSRLTHPGLTECGGRDGIEVTLGRIRNARRDGDKVRGDLHLGKFASKTPQGDLRGYVLSIAEEDPELFGLSIVFDADQYETAIVDEARPESTPSEDADGKHVVRYGRVKDVMAADVVGDPAANSDGLLSRLPEKVRNGITPELLRQWADDLSHTSNPRAAAPVNTRSRTMNDQLRDYLESIGLTAGAADEEAVKFWRGLDGEQRDEADRLADARPKAAETPERERVELTAEEREESERQLKAAGAQIERERVKQVRKLARFVGAPDEWADEQIDKGHSLSEALKEADKLMDTKYPSRPRIGGGTDLNRDSIAEGIRDAILLRAGRTLYEEEEINGRPQLRRDGNGRPVPVKPHPRAQQLRGLRLLGLMREWLSAVGVPNASYLSDIEVLGSVGPRGFARKFPDLVGLAQSTGDFSNIMVDAINKSLRAAYLDGPKTWPLFARMRMATDYKTIHSAALSEAPNLSPRDEGEVVTYVSLSDSKETYALEDYSGGIKLTRRAIINDDLDAFNRIPQLQANSAIRKEEDVVYAVLTGNAAMSDNVAIFHGTHANLGSGSGIVGSLDVDSLEAIQLLIRKQKGPKGAAYLTITPRFLLVPEALRITAMKLMRDTVLPGGTNAESNPFSGAFEVISNQRLDEDDAAAWYLLADPNNGQVDTIEVAFLQGQAAPVLEQETDFDTDDQKWKVTHTVAATALDFRGMAKNPSS